MATHLDELEINIFYKFLQTKMRDIYEKALESCYLFCIPSSNSLAGSTFTQNFTDYHILKPSPYFQSQYLTSHSKPKMVILDGNKLKPYSGFATNEDITILSEELSYNKNYEPYKVLLIEKPLDPSYSKKSVESAPPVKELNIQFSFDECCRLLASIPAIQPAVIKLNTEIEQFLKSYMILKDYLTDASTRLYSLCSGAVQNCVTNWPQLQTDMNQKESITIAVESYLLTKVYDKLFPVIIDAHLSQDKLIVDKLNLLRHLTDKELGINAKFSCSYTQTINYLAKLDIALSPYEKLKCVEDSLRCIEEDIAEHHKRSSTALKPQEETLVMSDDLIAILVRVLCECQPPRMASNLFYMEKFSWSDSTKNRFSFSLTTLKATVKYITSVNVNNLRVQYSDMDIDNQQKTKGGREKQCTEICKGSESTVCDTMNQSESEITSKSSGLSSVEAKLNKMARLLEISTISLEEQLKKSTTHDKSGS